MLVPKKQQKSTDGKASEKKSASKGFPKGVPAPEASMPKEKDPVGKKTKTKPKKDKPRKVVVKKPKINLTSKFSSMMADALGRAIEQLKIDWDPEEEEEEEEENED